MVAGDVQSLTASMRSSSSIVKGKYAATFFAQTLPLFPFLSGIEYKPRTGHSLLGIWITIMQFLSFVFNPRLAHGESLTATANIFYSFQLPLFDQLFVEGMTAKKYAPLFYISACTPILFLGVILWFLLSGKPVRRFSWYFMVFKYLIHGFSSILFIPMFQSYLSMMMCANVEGIKLDSSSHLWAFPEQECSGGFFWVSFVFAFIATICLFMVSFVCLAFLYDSDPLARAIKGRSNSTYDIILLCLKVLTVALFNVFLAAPTKKHYLPAYIAAVSILMVAIGALLLPYFSQQTTRYFSSGFLIVAMAAFLTFLAHVSTDVPVDSLTKASFALRPYGSPTTYSTSPYPFSILFFASMDLDCLLFFTLLIPLYLAGAWIADFRVNIQLIETLPALVDGRIKMNHPTILFPRNLPFNDLDIPSHKDICLEIADRAQEVFADILLQRDMEGNSSVVRPMLLTPFLTQIWLLSDIECSTRFLRVYYRISSVWPSPHMLLLATRIYTKGMTRYWNNAGIFSTFAQFTASYVGKASLALAQIEKVQRIDATLSTRYRSFKLQSTLKSEINIRDGTYQQQVDTAKKIHKETLMHIEAFWSKMQSDHVDPSQLANVASFISSRRVAGKAAFLHALAHGNNDRMLLTKYADFVEQVMFDSDSADQLRQLTEQEAEDRKLKVMRVARGGANGAGISSQIVFNQAIAEVLASHENAEPEITSTAILHQRSLWALVAVIILLLAGFLIYAFLFYRDRVNAIHCANDLSVVRSLVVTGGMLALQQLLGVPVTNVQDRLNAIENTVTDILTYHNKIVYGPQQSTLGDLISQQTLITLRYVTPNKSTFDLRPLISVGYDPAQQLQSTVRLATIGASDSVTGGIIRQQRETLKMTYLEAYERWFPTSLTRAVAMCDERLDQVDNTAIIVIVCLFALSLLLVLAYAVVVDINASYVDQFRASVLSLFPMIPREVTNQLQLQAAERVKTYDKREEEEPDHMLNLGNSAENNAAQLLHAEPTDPNISNHKGIGDEGAVTRSELRRDRRSHFTDQAQIEIENESLLHSHDQNNIFEKSATLVGLYEILGIVICVLFLLVLFILAVVTAVYHSNAVSTIGDLRESATAIFPSFVLTRNIRYSLSNFAALGVIEESVETQASIETLLDQLSNVAALDLSTNAIQGLLVVVRSAAAAIAQCNLVFSDVPTTASPRTYVASLSTQAAARRKSVFTYDDTVLTSLRTLLSNLDALCDNVAMDAKVDLTPQRIMASISIAVAAVFLPLAIYLAYNMMRANQHLFSTRLYKFLFGVVITGVVVGIATDITSLILMEEFEDESEDMMNLVRSRYDTAVGNSNGLMYARSFVVSGDELSFKYYEDFVTQRGDGYSIFSTFGPSDAERAEYLELINRRQKFEAIAFRLSIPSLTKNVEDFVKLYGNVTWNFDTEPDALAYRQSVLYEPYLYTNTATDTAKPAEEQQYLALQLLFSTRYKNVIDAAASLMHEVYNRRLEHTIDTVRDDGNGSVVATSIGAGGKGIALVASLIVIALGVRAYLANLSRTNRSSSSRKGSISAGRDSRATLLVRFSILLMLAMFTILFVLGYVNIIKHRNAAKIMEAANARETIFAQTMIVAEKFSSGYISNITTAERLDVLINKFTAKRTYVLTAGDIISGDKDQIHFLYGSNIALPAEYTCGYSPNGTAAIKSYIASGTANDVSNFRRALVGLATAPLGPSRTNVLNQLRGRIMPTLRELRVSSVYLLDHVIREVDSSHWAFVGIVIGLIVIMFLMSLFVVYPLVNTYTEDIAGSKLLLKLIPQSVRDEIPAILEFMEKDHSDDVAAGSSSQTLAEPSNVPVIAIDVTGVVLKYNSACEEIFGFSAAEVVGNNVSLLMPEKIARKHDFYLAKYRVTGQRKMIGFDRNVHARHQQGHLFPIELSIKEYRRSNGETIYFGFVRPIARTLELKAADELNNLILEFAPLPMCAIDGLGTVIRFNKAAEICFGHAAADIIHQNVKMLMPEEFAARHDSYLATYLRTHEKHIIDTNRRVTGLRKSGDVFPMDISVKEVKASEFDGMSTFLGYIRDATEDLELHRASLVNETVTNLAPIPIIGIDPIGKILKFNAAASKLWGYDHKKVLGQNVKMLMPDNVASVHDRYLDQYAKTGKRRLIGAERILEAKKADGSIFPVKGLIREIKRDNINTFIGYMVDYSSERQQAGLKGLGDAVVENHPVAILNMDYVGVLTKVNRSLCFEFGYNERDILGQNIVQLLPVILTCGSKQGDILSGIEWLAGKVRRIQGRRKSGELLQLEVTIEEVKDADAITEPEKAKSFVGYLRNITQEVTMESRQAINMACLDISPVPIVVSDATGTIVQFSIAARKLWKYDLNEVLGKNVSMLMPEHIRVHHNDFIHRYNQTGIKKMIDNVTISEGQDKYGNPFPLEICIKDITRPSKHFADMRLLARRSTTSSSDNQMYLDSDEELNSPNPIGVGVGSPFGPNSGNNNSNSATTQQMKDRGGFPAGNVARDSRYFIAYMRNAARDGEAQEVIERNALISELSPIPLIQIDLYGTVLMFNKAAEEEFGYAREEVHGRNVRMLMPDDIAKHHDQYVANYRKTRVRKVIGSLTRTKAKRKNGELFAVELMIDEVIVDEDPDQNTYIGYIRNVTEEQRLSKANQLSSVVSDLSPTPLVAINARGIVVNFNEAACRTFKYSSSSQVINHNVKMLMPDEVAIVHDGYLTAYAKTGEKHIIDSTRQITAKRSDGTLFPAELAVKEITHQGQESTFLSYIRDLTFNMQIAHTKRVTDVVQSLSTVPMIIIDHLGIIQDLNRATPPMFGYLDELDLIGSNVSILMTDAVGRHHDNYINQYLKTKQKHVIDTTRPVIALRRDGSTFTAELSVRELDVPEDFANMRGTRADSRSLSSTLPTPNSGPQKARKFFIAYLRNMDARFEMERNLSINTAITRGSAVPLIIINKNGIVQQFVPAAEQFFGYREEDVIGKNVKMLMPDDVAFHHDSYLSEYHRTKIKKVLDTTRLVHAKKANGTIVPVSITIREIPSKSGIGESDFIGYVLDQSKAHAVEMALATTVAVREMLPVAIISINDKGMVREFNREAEKFFGYNRVEVMGQNVNILMTHDVARVHDAYLEAYRRTLVRHIIGSTRSVVGKHKDGTELYIELQVSEFIVDHQRCFVGFANDRRAGMELEQSNRINNAMISLATHPIITIDSLNNINHFNPAAEKQFGYNFEEVFGQNVKMLMPSQIAEMHDSYIARYKSTGQSRVINQLRHVTALRKNGDQFKAEITVRRIDHDGQMLFVAYCRDISRELESRSNSIFASAISALMPDPFVAINSEGIVLVFSHAACQLFEYNQADVIGCNVSMLMPPEVAIEHNSFLKRYSQTREKHIIGKKRRVVAKTKSKKLIDVELHINEKIIEGKRFYFGYIRDCTHDSELALQTEIGEALVEFNPHAIITIDTSGTITRFNATAETLFQFDRQLVIGKNVNILMPALTARRHDQYLLNYLRTGVKRIVDAQNPREVTAEKKNGDTFAAYLSVRQLLDTEGKPSMFIGFIRPV